MRVLLVEDCPLEQQHAERCLRSGQIDADIVGTVREALFKATVNQYACILMDWNLPDGDGQTLCHDIRLQKIDTPVMMLSIRDDVYGKVACLETGADDYLTKPYAAPELLARIGALVRRGTKQKSTLYYVDDLELETRARIVRRAGREIKLTRREFDLLRYFMEKEGQVVTREDIWEYVWGWDEYPLHNTVEVHVKRLRAKINDRSQTYIHTIRGIGYRFQPPPLPSTIDVHGKQNDEQGR